MVFEILQELATKKNCHSCRSGDRGDLRPAGGHGGGHHRHREDTLAGQPWPGGRLAGVHVGLHDGEYTEIITPLIFSP